MRRLFYFIFIFALAYYNTRAQDDDDVVVIDSTGTDWGGGSDVIIPSMIVSGDVNKDGVIDESDLSDVVRFILDDADDKLVFKAADIDKSGIIEINDYAAIVNIILNKETRPKGTGYNTLKIKDVMIPKGSTGETLSILMSNEEVITGFQCDLFLQEGIEVDVDESGNYLIDVPYFYASFHKVASRLMPNGAIRIVCSSTSNASFSINNEIVLELSMKLMGNLAAGNYSVGIKNIVLTDSSGNRYTSDDNLGNVTIVDPVTITAKSYTREYGDANPTFEYTSEGATLVGVPEIICEATATSPVGEYPIIIRKGSVTNYNDSYVNGVLTITKAPLKISVGNYEKKQYDPMPDFVLSYEGFKNNETEEVLAQLPTLSCGANEDSAPGEYDIMISCANATNYEIQYVTGKLTVTEPASYTLTYMVDGEVYQSFSIKYRESVTALKEPTKEGYTFSGWSEIPGTMPSHDVTVTGTFTVNKYKVTYMCFNEVLKTELVEYGAPIPLPDILAPGTNILIIWENVPETMPAYDIIIMADETDKINSLTSSLSKGEGDIYDLNGRKLSAARKRINIICLGDGTTRKVLVK